MFHTCFQVFLQSWLFLWSLLFVLSQKQCTAIFPPHISTLKQVLDFFWLILLVPIFAIRQKFAVLALMCPYRSSKLLLQGTAGRIAEINKCVLLILPVLEWFCLYYNPSPSSMLIKILKHLNFYKFDLIKPAFLWPLTQICDLLFPQSWMAKRPFYPPVRAPFQKWLGASFAELHGSSKGAGPQPFGWVCGKRGRATEEARDEKTVQWGKLLQKCVSHHVCACGKVWLFSLVKIHNDINCYSFLHFFMDYNHIKWGCDMNELLQ